MWKDVMRNVKTRLDKWRGRFLSIGGRIVLINLVLNVIPLYTISFCRALKAVIKNLVAIQRKFLWGGVDRESSINWFRWKDVCKAKEKGGLGIRDIESMNISLLMKWK